MPYAWKVEYNSVDISDKISGFTITASLESFCREMTLDIADRDFYDNLDFSQISEEPEIEIFTKVGSSYVSQGLFYIERPAIASTVDSDTLQGVWGRSITAKLSDPFSPKVNETWETKTTFFAICEEMCELAGLTWDESYCEIDDYVILPLTYKAENAYPISVITELAGFAGALVTTDRAGHVCIKRVDYAPSVADVTINDVDIQEIYETPEWPEFGNRVKIIPTGSVSGYSIDLIIPDNCLAADGAAQAKLFAQVKDEEGSPVNGMLVDWSDNGNASLLYGQTNTQDIRITREQKRATNYYSVKVDFPPSSVDGIWAASDVARQTNLIADGYTVEGNTITLADRLAYCDQLLVIDYWSDGIAVNYLQAGTTSEDVTVTAALEDETDTGVVYIDNPCQCPPTLTLRAAPTSIHIAEVSALIVYMEESGPVTTGRTVYMEEIGDVAHGSLSWDGARLGTVTIENEETAAINEIAGLTQCELSMFPASVSSIYIMGEDGDGNPIPTGDNLYSSHEGKVVTLSTQLTGATALLAGYVAQGAALNHFTAEALGTANIKTWAITNREAGLEADCQIRVLDETSEVGETTVIFMGTGGDEGEFDEKDKPDPSGTCAPENVSGDPTDNALSGRFSKSVTQGCTCEEICNLEFRVYGTTQNYDGASYRKIADIVTKDHGYTEGTPEYWEKYNELKTDALAACLNQCDDCGTALAWGSNPETITPGTSVFLSVTGGKGPFFWSVSGTGFSLANNGTTDLPSNLLIADGSACGSATITVTDNCGFEVTGYVRSTVGVWCLIDTCSTTSMPLPTSCHTLIQGVIGKYKYSGYCCKGGCYSYYQDKCVPYCAGGGCESPLTLPSGYLCFVTLATYEWKCAC